METLIGKPVLKKCLPALQLQQSCVQKHMSQTKTEAVRKANHQAQMDKEQAMFEEAMRRREMEDEKLRMKLEQQQKEREKEATQKKDNE